ncbi:MAG: NupC/NupG family nucleoside CNT transporter [Candidatus Aminicenantales bacterium]
MTAYNLVSFAGIFVLAAVAWLFSSNRKVVNARVLIWGIGLQLLVACFIFVVPAGTTIFLWVNDAVTAVLGTAMAGVQFVFGRLALPPGMVSASGEASLGYFLAFQGLPTIIFFAALLGALYYLGIMPFFVRLFARIFSRSMRISGAEALSVSANIFVGVESALVVRPHLKDMTVSELGTIITAGMGTIASTVLAMYVMMLQKEIPTIAGHLVSASFISAPACIVMAKLIMPETAKPLTLGLDVKPHYDREDNLIMAIINGAGEGLKLLGGIVTLLIAFLGLLALVNLGLGWAGGLVNGLFGWHVQWSLEAFLGYLFYPLTLAMGVPPSDALPIAKILGDRTILTEVFSYGRLADLMAGGALHDPRSAIIASYALCGFAHVASLAIFIGGTGALVPTRVKDISRIGFRALLAATLACLMTGAVAGTFYTGSSLLFRR